MMLAREIPDEELGARGTVVLPDGFAVSVRAVTSGDAERLRRMFSRSSPATIYRRFHSPFPRLREWALEAFTCVTLAENRRAFLLVAAVFAEVGYALEGGSYVIRAPLRSLKTSGVVDRKWISERGGR